MICADAENIDFAGTSQRHLDIAHTINAIGSHLGKGDTPGQCPLDRGLGNRGLGGETMLLRHMGPAPPLGIIRPCVRQIKRPDQ